MFTAAGSPVEINLSSGLLTVLQNFQGTFLSRLQVLALNHFPADAETENIVGTGGRAGLSTQHFNDLRIFALQ